MSKPKFRCVIHGSLRRHYDEIQTAAKLFESAGIEVLAPDLSPVSQIKDGFAYFEGQENQDLRLIELKYLHNLRLLGENGFSYFVNPEGYVGKSASYELGIAQLTNVATYFSEQPADHPAYLPHGSVWMAQNLADFII